MEQVDTKTDTIDEKLTITVEEAAKMLGIGKNMMLDVVKAEGFPAIKFNRKIIINKKQFIRWFDELSFRSINV